MLTTIDNSTRTGPVSPPKRLTAHCIVLGNDCDDGNAANCPKNQTESVDAITVVARCETVALSAALAAVRSDLVFFLHHGDTWTEDFVARVGAVFRQHPEADIVSCEPAAAAAKNNSIHLEADAIDLGYSAVATYAGLEDLDLPLSCLSIRRRIIERILPLVDDPDWLEEPAVPLTIAASLASARRFHLPRSLVTSDFTHEPTNQLHFSERLKRMRLVGKIANQLGLNPDFVKQFLAMEYNSCRKDPPTITKYCRLLQAYHPDTRSRRQILLSMYRNMKEHLRGDGSLGGYLRRWWLKRRIRWTGRLAV